MTFSTCGKMNHLLCNIQIKRKSAAITSTSDSSAGNIQQPLIQPLVHTLHWVLRPTSHQQVQNTRATLKSENIFSTLVKLLHYMGCCCIHPSGSTTVRLWPHCRLTRRPNKQKSALESVPVAKLPPTIHSLASPALTRH